jgi:hypothetical protein
VIFELANFSLTKIAPECDCSTGKFIYFLISKHTLFFFFYNILYQFFKGFPNCPLAAAGDINYRKKIKLKTRDIM